MWPRHGYRTSPPRIDEFRPPSPIPVTIPVARIGHNYWLDRPQERGQTPCVES